ncbi:facilitated trehalose transporter Tret1-like [Uranotaenia lowii]|uniref:facilitated trehalose transporter Tret1-like n=1 Tax=Uranotaenia lowii TaxID=190385 RepID=UPI002479E95F|nr:facilitated trehalose transporter Tret1-like [Uranotaenia lowii]
MSNNRQGGGPVGRIVDKIKRTMTNEGDDTRDPLQYGYQRVNTGEGSLSTSTTATSLDTIVLDTNADDLAGTPRAAAAAAQRPFSPILETEDTNPFLDPPAAGTRSSGTVADSKSKSKSSLKGSRVSFDEDDDRFDETDEGFRKQREHFQRNKSHSSSAAHKNQLIKELRHLLAADNRRQFQGKKHVSLDVQSSKVLEELLKASSSEDDFEGQRRQFQERKHRSLDNRHISFKFEKEPSPSSSDEDFEPSTSLLKIDADITKPVIIDLKDLDSSEDEDYISSRKHFQQSKSMSTDSRKSGKSIRFFEMEMGTKEENLRSAVPFVRQITEDGKAKLEVYRPTTNPIFIWTQKLEYCELGSLNVHMKLDANG